MEDGTVYVSAPLRFMDAFDPEGKHLWHFYADSSTTASPGFAENGTVFLPAKYNDFYVFEMSAPLAKTAWPKFRGNARNTGNVNDGAR
jgi:hypothetical protein